MANNRISRRVIEVECCLNRKCFICAGLNRKVVFADDVEESGQARKSPTPKKKANYERGSCLSEEKRQLLVDFIAASPQHRTDIAILSNLCVRTIDNAVNGNKMFNGTKRALEKGLELMVQYVRNSQEVHDSHEGVSTDSDGPKRRRKKGSANSA